MKSKILVDSWVRQDNCIWLNTGDDGKIQVWPCKENKRKVIVWWILTVFTAGFTRLLFFWKPLWQAVCTCEYTEPENADRVLVRSEGDFHLRLIRIAMWPDGLTLFCPGGSTIDVQSCRYFTFKKLTFDWHPLVKMFHKLFGFDADVPLTLLASQKGLSSSEANKRLAIMGSNEIAADLKPIYELLFREVFSPFYFFQVFSVCVWYSEGYQYYATIIIIISAVSVTINVWQTRRNQRNLRDMMYSIGIATVWRDGEWKKKCTTILVPGDVIYVDIGEMHCDAVLLRGSAIVNEAMLTGESVPTTKTPIRPESAQTDERYDSKEHAKQTLFCGTKVLQTKHAPGEPVTAVVIRTGFSTTKGRLVRTIMYPKAVEFEFTRDLFRFIGVFFVIAIIGFIYTLILMIRRANGFERIATRSLDIITIVVPPALPAAITIGIIAAQRRLKLAMIYCTSPTTINTAGGVNVTAFDKTGTLTEEGLDLFGIIPNECIERERAAIEVNELPADSEMIRVMASCHSLTQLNDQLAGDPMDMILFEQTNWKLADSKSKISETYHDPNAWASGDGEEDDHHMIVRSADHRIRIGILREYSFTSSLRRMSVFVHVQGSSESGYFLYCKGAPETVATLCLENTVPSNFVKVLRSHAKCGYRVIALACKKFQHANVEQIFRMSRVDLEKDMHFLGMVVFENRLKDQTIPNIRILKNANLRTVMVTGDNMLTAVSVAHECGILDDQRPLYTIEAELIDDQPKITLHTESAEPDRIVSAKKRDHEPRNQFVIDLDRQNSRKGKTTNPFEDREERKIEPNYQLAISGSSYAVITSKSPELVPKLTAVCDVYARMAPEQKIQLITNLQSLGYIVAMCGDGANDCGALKAAHVGCSLSEAEASIASPFTSQIPDIRCIPTLIREGRTSLVTTFGVVKYMCCYSIVQFLAVVILYWIGSNLSDFQFLYSDLVLTTTFAIFFGYTSSSIMISPAPPPTKILTFTSVSSIVSQMFLVLAFQVFAFEFVKLQPWFVPYVFPGDENNYFSYQTTCVFFTASFQQIVLCIVYSKSRPYRRSILSNYLLTGALVVTTAMTVVLLLAPGSKLTNFMNFKMPPEMKYRAFIILLAILHFFLAINLEKLIEFLVPLIEPYLPCKRPKAKYVEILESDVSQSPNWLRAKIVGDRELDENGHANPAFQSNEEL